MSDGSLRMSYGFVGDGGVSNPKVGAAGKVSIGLSGEFREIDHYEFPPDLAAEQLEKIMAAIEKDTDNSVQIYMDTASDLAHAGASGFQNIPVYGSIPKPIRWNLPMGRVEMALELANRGYNYLFTDSGFEFNPSSEVGRYFSDLDGTDFHQRTQTRFTGTAEIGFSASFDALLEASGGLGAAGSVWYEPETNRVGVVFSGNVSGGGGIGGTKVSGELSFTAELVYDTVTGESHAVLQFDGSGRVDVGKPPDLTLESITGMSPDAFMGAGLNTTIRIDDISGSREHLLVALLELLGNNQWPGDQLKDLWDGVDVTVTGRTFEGKKGNYELGFLGYGINGSWNDTESETQLLWRKVPGGEWFNVIEAVQ